MRAKTKMIAGQYQFKLNIGDQSLATINAKAKMIGWFLWSWHKYYECS